MAEQRRIFFELVKKEIKNPVIIKRDYSSLDSNLLMLYSATDLGALYIDGFGDGVWMTAKDFKEKHGFSDEQVNGIDMPIGVPIACETPEDIAVSILAKLIDVKNTENK